jgi:hypothetical protein
MKLKVIIYTKKIIEWNMFSSIKLTRVGFWLIKSLGVLRKQLEVFRDTFMKSIFLVTLALCVSFQHHFYDKLNFLLLI